MTKWINIVRVSAGYITVFVAVLLAIKAIIFESWGLATQWFIIALLANMMIELIMLNHYFDGITNGKYKR